MYECLKCGHRFTHTVIREIKCIKCGSKDVRHRPDVQSINGQTFDTPPADTGTAVIDSPTPPATDWGSVSESAASGGSDGASSGGDCGGSDGGSGGGD